MSKNKDEKYKNKEKGMLFKIYFSRVMPRTAKLILSSHCMSSQYNSEMIYKYGGRQNGYTRKKYYAD